MLYALPCGRWNNSRVQGEDLIFTRLSKSDTEMSRDVELTSSGDSVQAMSQFVPTCGRPLAQLHCVSWHSEQAQKSWHELFLYRVHHKAMVSHTVYICHAANMMIIFCPGHPTACHDDHESWIMSPSSSLLSITTHNNNIPD